MLGEGKTIKIARLLILVIAGAGLVFPAESQATTLSELLNQKDTLQKQADQSRKKIQQKKQEASNLKGVINNIDDDITDTTEEISNTESQIQTTNAILDALRGEIGKTQAQLNDLNVKLKSAYSNLYELSQTGTVELLLQNKSIEDLVSQTQYIQAIQTDLQKNITYASQLRDDLESKKKTNEDQKSSLESLNKQLTSSKNSLASQRSQKDYLLKQTQGEQNQYEALLKKLESQKETLDKQIYEERRRLAASETIIGGTGGYPWAGEGDAYAVDPWLFYKRQCTSFAAYKFQAYFGRVFYNTRPGQGSAWNWPALASDQGYHTTKTPRANSVVSWPVGRGMPYGHVAWVTGINANGTIDVEEYNWVNERSYDQRFNIDPSRYGSATYIYP